MTGNSEEHEWEEVQLRNALFGCANRTVVADTGEDPTVNLRQYLSDPDVNRRFRASFARVMQDKARPWREKAMYFVGEHYTNEANAQKRFEELWHIATGENWKWDKQ